MKVVLEVEKDGFTYRFSDWTDININLRLNTVASTFSLTGWMSEQNKFIFEPYSYLECKVYVEELKGVDVSQTRQPLITGYLVNPGLKTQKKPELTQITGFSRPGILEYAYMSPSIGSFQYKNTSIRTIAQIICDYFRLELYVHPGAIDKANEKIEEFEIKIDQPLKNFLSELCRDKGITVAHDNLGRLMLYRIVNITPATSKITQEDFHISMSTSPNGQGMHTEVNCLLDGELEEQAKEGDQAELERPLIATAKSPFLKRKTSLPGSNKNTTVDLRIPRNIQVKKATNKQELQQKANYEMSQEARNFPIVATKEGWDFKGRIVRAGFYLEIQHPDLFIEETVKTVVEEMVFTKKAKKPEMLTFTCLLPCVYTGVLPSKSPFKV